MMHMCVLGIRVRGWVRDLCGLDIAGWVSVEFLFTTRRTEEIRVTAVAALPSRCLWPKNHPAHRIANCCYCFHVESPARCLIVCHTGIFSNNPGQATVPGSLADPSWHECATLSPRLASPSLGITR